MHPGEVGIYKTFVKHTANITRECAENKKCHIRPAYNASGFQKDSTLKRYLSSNAENTKISSKEGDDQDQAMGHSPRHAAVSHASCVV